MVHSPPLRSTLARRIQGELGATVRTAGTMGEAEAEVAKGDLLLAVTHPTFGDEANLDAVDWILRTGTPTVVLTSSFTEDTRECLLEAGVVDYLLTDARCAEHLVSLVGRLLHNDTTVLVVDDSAAMRQQMINLLTKSHYRVLTANSAEEGYEVLRSKPEIRVLLTDYEMPGLNGVEFVAKVRALRGYEELAIIGLSGRVHHSVMTARFLKHGANDFLPKPFLPEELHCRVNRSVDLLDRMRGLREAKAEADRLVRNDPLTGVLRRPTFLEEVSRGLQNRTGPVSLCLLDIDHLKAVNDSWGHAAGDEALQAVAAACLEHAGEGAVGRVGGEELALFLPGVSLDAAAELSEALRTEIEEKALRTAVGDLFHVTVSIGVAEAESLDDVEDLLRRADAGLDDAKRGGGDQVAFNAAAA